MPAAALPLPYPEAESARLDALDRCEVLDTPPEPAFDDLARLATIVCAAPAAAFAVIDRDRVWLKARVGIDASELPRSWALAERAFASAGPGADDVRELLAEADAPLPALRIDGMPARFVAGAPVHDVDGYVLGTLCVADTAARTLHAAQRDGLHLLARQAGHLLAWRRLALEQGRRMSEHEADARRAAHAHAELERRHERLLDSAQRDPLTGLFTRAALARMLEVAPEADGRTAPRYCLVVLDIDHFKQVNDRHGHLLGDRALRAVADVVQSSVRAGDVAVRFGGEEFLVALPATELPHAAEVAHRIRERVQAIALPFPLTVSVGVAAGDPASERPEQVFDRADQALYRAKVAGRNRVVIDDTLRL